MKLNKLLGVNLQQLNFQQYFRYFVVVSFICGENHWPT